MKKLIFILVLLVTGLVYLGIYTHRLNNTDPIQLALEEYYEPDRVMYMPYFGELDVVHTNYKYISHKVLGIVHYGDEATEYRIEHIYMEDIVDTNSDKISKGVTSTDTIRVKIFSNIPQFYQVNDGFRWKFK